MQLQIITIEEIYQEILDGHRSRFPPGTWKLDTDNEMARRVTKYLIKTILQWNEDEIKQNWNTSLLVKYRLRGVLQNKYENSPYKMLNDTFPQKFKEWELGMTPLNFWTKKKALQVLKWTIEEKEQLTSEKLLKVYGLKWLQRQRLSAPLRTIWNGSPYAMINDLYPDLFKEWQFSMVPNKFWTKEKAIEALKWTIEKKEMLNIEHLKLIYGYNWLVKSGLKGACQLFWKDSPYAMINDAYPNQFKEWEFKMTPTGFWTKENALEALRWTIEEKEQLTDNQLLQCFTIKWIVKHKLWTPLIRYWNGSPYAMLNDLYPSRYTKYMLKGYIKRV
ncbi:hypothetical protein BK727_07265 [Bacillus thuringiensis serovar roskildiensis]|uniref:DUF4046 domain-containing protein n=1 Tax=Bacillus thuringiensis serovar sooncheon TaxID=180891 RepID=A0A9Q5SN82_BACTU|nr:DUF4046 domain-containing protein [Bacillus thuringiensis]MEB9661367.1 DUF4046 domain-containing protein [Bacillus cereus]ARV91359.1 hypothetical protein BJG91_01505 [Bacillus thuringiensis]OTW70703.1 hypothetical protein BK707_11000 [Bacillus thuringiensis serovar coreanensis]OTX53152.1 hypothetical protein BK724_04765 [Bacillus thuringiensis serovar sooncheon]OTX56877.1 hypothetical protein BK725_08310 [Bacillus thuringiensis serovar guiyangiensis]